MNKTLANLIRLQERMEQCEHGGRTAGLRKQIDRVRAKVPEAILRRFGHLIQYGRVPLARLSESGACGSCHLKLLAADAGRVRQEPDELHVCPHCGC